MAPRRGPAPSAPARAGWAELPGELLEKVGRAVPAGGRLWFRLVCRSWAAAGAGVAQVDGEGLPPGKVTRTRGADAAVSAARAEMVLDCLEGSDRVKFESEICKYAAWDGHLAVLQWARAQGCPWYEWTCAEAAKNGHLAVLQWARAQGCPWDEETCSSAAMNGHLAVLQWARAQGCPYSDDDDYDEHF